MHAEGRLRRAVGREQLTSSYFIVPSLIVLLRNGKRKEFQCVVASVWMSFMNCLKVSSVSKISSGVLPSFFAVLSNILIAFASSIAIFRNLSSAVIIRFAESSAISCNDHPLSSGCSSSLSLNFLFPVIKYRL